MKIILLLVPLLVSCSQLNRGDVIEEVRRENEAAEAEAKECRAWEAKGKELKLPREKELHANREEALRVLAYLESRPLQQPHSNRLIKIYDEHFEELAELPYQAEALALRYITAVCGPFEGLAHLSPLFNEQKKFSFNAEERRRVSKVAREFYAEKADQPTGLIYKLVQVSALGNYIEQVYAGPNRLNFLKEARELSIYYDGRRKAITAAFDDALAKHGKYSLRTIEFEHQEVARFAKAQSSLLTRFFKACGKDCL